MSFRRYLVPFAAGVAVGAALHKHWPALREKLSRAREKLGDIVAEIREEEEAAAKSSPPVA